MTMNVVIRSTLLVVNRDHELVEKEVCEKDYADGYKVFLLPR